MFIRFRDVWTHDTFRSIRDNADSEVDTVDREENLVKCWFALCYEEA